MFEVIATFAVVLGKRLFSGGAGWLVLSRRKPCVCNCSCTRVSIKLCAMSRHIIKLCIKRVRSKLSKAVKIAVPVIVDAYEEPASEVGVRQDDIRGPDEPMARKRFPARLVEVMVKKR